MWLVVNILGNVALESQREYKYAWLAYSISILNIKAQFAQVIKISEMKFLLQECACFEGRNFILFVIILFKTLFSWNEWRQQLLKCKEFDVSFIFFPA